MTTLRKGWWGTDLGPYRPCEGTYCFFEESGLPALPPLDGTFSWLLTGPREGSAAGVPSVAPPPEPVRVPDDPDLPAAYATFLRRPELMTAIPSCTACYWSPATQPVPSPFGDGTRLLRFLSDQQDVLFWYLWLGVDGGHRVVCGSYPYHEVTVTAEQAARDLVEVAPEFEAFCYRFWVENLAWFEVNESGLDETSRTGAVQRYLASL